MFTFTYWFVVLDFFYIKYIKNVYLEYMFFICGGYSEVIELTWSKTMLESEQT